MELAKSAILQLILVLALLHGFEAKFSCQVTRREKTERIEPVFFGTSNNGSTEDCGLVPSAENLTDSFPWDVVVYFPEEQCVSPGVVISQRAILFDLETCNYKASTEITIFLAGIEANYAKAPHITTSEAYDVNSYIAIALFPMDLNAIAPNIKPACVYNQEENSGEHYETFLLSEEDEIVKKEFGVQSEEYCVKKLQNSVQCETFNSNPILCVQPLSGLPKVFSTSEFLYMKVNGRYFVRGKFIQIYQEEYATSTIFDLTSLTSHILSVVPDIYKLDPQPEPKRPPKFMNPENLSFPGCGRQQVKNNFVSLIVQGVDLQVNDLNLHPWHILIEAAFYNDQQDIQTQSCGGTLISDTVIVTAAHCLYAQGTSAASTIDPQELKVTAGAYNQSVPQEPSRQSRRVKKIIIHEKYSNTRNDIALIVVTHPFDITSYYVQPACLWNSDTSIDLLSGVYGNVVGWGLDENFKSTQTLRVAEIPIFTHQDCFQIDRKFYAPRLSYEDNFCAGVVNGTSVCNGDSGGGLILFFQTPRRYFLRGIVSVTKSQTVERKAVCDNSVLALFTDVAQFHSWIVEKIPDFK